MNVKEIVAEYLKANGYDALCAVGVVCCGCNIDDFMPCGEPSERCEPGYWLCCHECGIWFASPTKDGQCPDCEGEDE